MNAGVVGSLGLFEARHYLRDKIALFTTILLPLILVTIIGMAALDEPTSFTVGVLDQDGTASSAAFVEDLDDAALTTTPYTDQPDMERDIRLGFLSGGVVVEEGFEAALQAPEGQAIVTLSVEATSTNSSTVAGAVTATAAEFALEPTAVRVTVAALDLSDAEAASVEPIAGAVAGEIPPITTESVTVGEQVEDNGFARAISTQFVLFTFLNGMLAGMTLVESRRLGVARRLLSTQTGVGPYTLGVGLGRWWLGLLQAVLLFGTGVLVFGASFGDPVAGTVLAALWAALSAAVGVLVGAVMRTPDQVVAVSLPLGIGMAMLGGSMWPLSVVPPFMQTIGHLTPHAWANDAWIILVEEGGGLADIWLELGVLTGITVGVSALAVVLLRRSLSR